MERNIGDAGEFLNNSVATRAVNIEPDMAKVRRLDIYHQRYRTYLQIWGIGGLVLLAAGVALCYFHHPILGGLLLLPASVILVIAARLPQTLRGDAYRNGLLVPGIISSLAPLTVTCLTSVRNDDEEVPAGGIVWGVKQVVMPQLTVQPERLGEQVPCVSLFGETSADGTHYINFEPRPLAWGTSDARIIEQARQAIDEEEWLLLPLAATAYAGAEKNENDIAFFDADLTPIRLSTWMDEPLSPSRE